MKRKSKIIIYVKADIDFTKALRMYCIDFSTLKRRATLSTLNVLKILILLKADKLVPYLPFELISISTIESKTTIQSK